MGKTSKQKEMRIEEIKSPETKALAIQNKKTESEDLINSFDWEHTNQGVLFWFEVNEKNPSTEELKKEFSFVFKVSTTATKILNGEKVSRWDAYTHRKELRTLLKGNQTALQDLEDLVEWAEESF